MIGRSRRHPASEPVRLYCLIPCEAKRKWLLTHWTPAQTLPQSALVPTSILPGDVYPLKQVCNRPNKCEVGLPRPARTSCLNTVKDYSRTRPPRRSRNVCCAGAVVGPFRVQRASTAATLCAAANLPVAEQTHRRAVWSLLWVRNVPTRTGRSDQGGRRMGQCQMQTSTIRQADCGIATASDAHIKLEALHVVRSQTVGGRAPG